MGTRTEGLNIFEHRWFIPLMPDIHFQLFSAFALWCNAARRVNETKSAQQVLFPSDAPFCIYKNIFTTQQLERSSN